MLSIVQQDFKIIFLKKQKPSAQFDIHRNTFVLDDFVTHDFCPLATLLPNKGNSMTLCNELQSKGV